MQKSPRWHYDEPVPSSLALSADELLSRSGLRKTPVRLGVIEVLTRSARPISVPQILAKMKGAVDTVTVYRTLHAFVRKKLVHRVRGEDRSWLYAISVSDQRPQHLHPHFVCDRCGRVECLEKVQLPSTLLPSLGISGGYRVRWPEVVLHGLCPKCDL
jgi:Fur family ferric uptake transcriptional regulator